MTQLVYWSKDYNWRRTSCNRYLPTPNDNCIINNEAYINCPNINNHSSSLFYHNGILYLTWFSGDNEGDDGCNIYISRLNIKNNSKLWSDPEIIITEPGYACQNSCIYHDGTQFVMFFSKQKHKIGDPDAKLYLATSSDTHTWESLLFDNTFGILTRNRILHIDNNIKYLPYYYCDFDKQASNYIYQCGYYKYENGKWNIYKLSNTQGLMEMVIINPSQHHLKCYYRDKKARNIYMNQSIDDGKTWSQPEPIQLENNDSAFDIVDYTYHDIKYYIMCCNRKHDRRNLGRAPLSLYITDNNSVMNDNWKFVKDLDPTMEMPYYVWKYAEFSYPALQIVGNKLHISYTYNRKTIKHVIVSLTDCLEVLQ